MRPIILTFYCVMMVLTKKDLQKIWKNDIRNICKVRVPNTLKNTSQLKSRILKKLVMRKKQLKEKNTSSRVLEENGFRQKLNHLKIEA